MLKRQDRQRIVNEYLNASGANYFVPSEFLAWLREHPDHECHDLFFGRSDEEAAQSYREQLVRQWVSGLRITVLRPVPAHRQIGGVTVQEYRLPMMVSPHEIRKGGGGYVTTDPDDDGHVKELALQAGSALAAWIARYEGACGMAGVDVSRVKETVGEIEASLVDEAIAAQ